MTVKSPMRAGAWRRWSSSAPAGLLITAALAGGFPAALSAQRAAYEELQTFSGVLRHIQLNYVDSVTYGQLVPAAIRGMLRALDPHSYYVARADWEKQNALERGELGTTGILLEDVEGVPTVVAVLPRSPAAKSGVLPGDRLVMVNDTAVVG
ncbi:MAG TPA: PDZ domain-containing protein, partial [Gemmatimonadales bacterium]|nr:PDZ domain-containing protein [Gemmatimonadales bacterium]